jgi:hypothetical protein
MSTHEACKYLVYRLGLASGAPSFELPALQVADRGDPGASSDNDAISAPDALDDPASDASSRSFGNFESDSAGDEAPLVNDSERDRAVDAAESEDEEEASRQEPSRMAREMEQLKAVSEIKGLEGKAIFVDKELAQVMEGLHHSFGTFPVPPD